MGRKIWIVFVTLLIVVLSAIIFFYLSTIDIAVLSPKGMIADQEKRLLIIVTLLMLIIVIPTFIITIFFAWRYKEGNKGKHTPDVDQHPAAEVIWWGIPFLIVLVIGALTWQKCHELDPFKPIVNGTERLKVQVVALQWKWLFIYPDQKIATVNFVQFPENTPLDFEITADAPMNSFWIPKLGGQIYAMPGMRSKLHLIANDVGSFRGVSANLSGKGFSEMEFTAKSSSKEDFDAWVQSVKESSLTLDSNTYQQLAAPSENNIVAYYSSSEESLYEKIVMKYMPGMVHASQN